MVVLTITANYDGYATSANVKDDTSVSIDVGLYQKGGSVRSFIRFPLDALPPNAQITQVRLYVYCYTAGSSTHLTDVHAYGTNGQEDPQPDDAQTAYNRCASGNLYVDDSDALRTTGDKWFVLGGSVITDLVNAKNAVNRFSLALHEEGDNDAVANLASLENTSDPYPPKLEITYTVPGIAVPRYVGDGLAGAVIFIPEVAPGDPWEGWYGDEFI
jgi:hypothetical protein